MRSCNYHETCVVYTFPSCRIWTLRGLMSHFHCACYSHTSYQVSQHNFHQALYCSFARSHKSPHGWRQQLSDHEQTTPTLPLRSSADGLYNFAHTSPLCLQELLPLSSDYCFQKRTLVESMACKKRSCLSILQSVSESMLNASNYGVPMTPPGASVKSWESYWRVVAM